jgi:hypothetical protein
MNAETRQVGIMKKTYLIFVLVLIIFAWPIYYLYQRQLGSIPFLLIAIFFFYVTARQLKQFKSEGLKKKEKIKRNHR